MTTPHPLELEPLQKALERCDEELVRLVVVRGRLAWRLAAERARRGQARFSQEGELATVRRFRPLGSPGVDLAVLLLRLARSAPFGPVRPAGTSPGTVGPDDRTASIDGVAA